MGLKAITSHAKSIKHSEHEKSVSSSCSIQGSFASVPHHSPHSHTTSSSSASVLKPYIIDTASKKAEILWTLKLIKSHFSLRSVKNLSPLFWTMFLDSKIASNMSLGYDKVMYTALFGLYPYFHDELISEIETCRFFRIIWWVFK